MAITSTQQTDILKVVAGLFNAAPGGTNLSDLANAVDGGMTIKQLANVLASNTLFTNGIMAGKVTTDAQAAVLMNNFGLVADNTTTSAGSQALAYFKAQIDAGVGFGDIVFDAVTFLSTTTDATFTTAATLLANKALVAESYSASNSSSDLSVLQNVVSTVTGAAPFTAADVATVLAALSDDVAPAVTAPAGNFSFTENQAAAATLATIAATDNVAVTGFEIASGNDSGFFAIDAAGKITLTTAGLTSAANDFETTPNSFTLGVKAIDSAGNKSAAVDVILGVTDADDVAPTFKSAVINGTTATMSFSEALSTTAATPAVADFTVGIKGGSGSIAVSAVKVTGSTVELTLGRAPATGETFTVAHTAGANALQDLAGNKVVSFAAQDVVLDTTVPVVTAGQTFTFVEAVSDGKGGLTGTVTKTTDVIGTVAATDNTGVTSFAIASGNDKGWFAINATTGQLTLTTAGLSAASNDFETTPNSFALGITAKDGAGNVSTAGTVTINLTNNTADDPVVQTFTLTNSVDNKTGGSSNDTFDGALNVNGNVTFNSFDNLDGGAGTDSLIAVGVGTLSTTGTTLQNIENVELIGVTNAATIDLSATTGIKSLAITSPAAGTRTVNGIASGITDVNVTGMTTNGDATTFAFQTAAVSGSTDSINLNLSSNSPAVGNNVTVNLNPASGTNGFETVTVKSSGGNNGDPTGVSNGTVTISDGASTTLATLKVTGTSQAALTLTPDTVKTIDVSGNSAGVAVNMAATANQAQTITGGAGNDAFNLGVTFDKNDSIAGGEGTDTLQFDINNSAFALTDTFAVSGIETLRLSTTALNGTLDVSKFGAGVATTRLDIALAADRSITNLAANPTIELRDLSAFTLTGSLANSTGTTDALTLNLRSIMVTGGATTDTMAGFTHAGIETITIDSGSSDTPDNAGDQNIITTLTATAMKTLNVKGTVGLSVGTLGASVTLVDSTALAAALSSTTAGDGGLTATLGTSANVAATVKTGGGNDSITGGAGDETITTGAGVDVINIATNGGVDNVNAGSGNDRIEVTAANLGTTSATFDTIAGGDGTDTLRVTATGTLVDSMFTNATGMEILDAGTGSFTVNANLGSLAAAAFTSAVRIDQGAGAAQLWNVNASSFSSSQTLDFRGAAATAVMNDVIVGGQGNDKITGGINAATLGDTMTGGAGADIFFFRTRAEVIDASLTGGGTVSTEMDRITDFSAGVDKIQLDITANAFSAGLTNTAATTVTVASGANTADRATLTALATATETLFTGVASTNAVVRAYVLTTGAEITTATGLANKTFLIINDDTAAIAATDTWIDITGLVGTISSGDFVFGNLLA